MSKYDPDCLEAADKLISALSRCNVIGPEFRPLIAKALKDYACEADKRITSDQWAQKYRQACIEISYFDDLLEASKALREIVEGVTSERWASAGRRLKDAKAWCAFYVALAAVASVYPKREPFCDDGEGGQSAP